MNMNVETIMERTMTVMGNMDVTHEHYAKYEEMLERQHRMLMSEQEMEVKRLEVESSVEAKKAEAKASIVGKLVEGAGTVACSAIWLKAVRITYDAVKEGNWSQVGDFVVKLGRFARR